MALSETGSGHEQWAPLGGWPHHIQPSVAWADASESVVVSTTSSTTITGPGKPAAPPPPQQQLGVEGRVGKPVRRRSRASRRAPTTMLNTDTANFRSMVQQFTGIPSGPYSTVGLPVSNNLLYDFTDTVHRTTAMSFRHLQPQLQFQGPNNPSVKPPQQQVYQFTKDNASSAAIGGNGGSSEAFLPGFNNPGANFEVGNGFFSDGMYSQMMPRPTSTTNSGDDGFFFEGEEGSNWDM